MNRLYTLIAHAVLGSFGWLFALSPRSLRNFYAICLGKCLSLISFRRKVIESNLERAKAAWPEGTLGEIHKEAEAVYRRLGRLFLEITLVFGGMRTFVRKCTITKGLDNIEKSQKKKRPIIYLTSHIGNWEIMVACAAHSAVDFLMVTKRLKPAWLHELIESRRKSYGVIATYEPKTLKDVLKWLRNKRGVGFILDQYAGPPIGVRVPFFGTYVGTSSAVATLVRRMDACVVPVVNFCDENGTYVTEFFPEIEWVQLDDLQEEICVNTARYTDFIEQQIKLHPSQWLWTHRRFKGDLSDLKAGEWKSSRDRGDKNQTGTSRPQNEMPKN